MSSLPEPSNEQKLTYIYQVMKSQESRRKRKAWMWFLKFVLFIALVTYIYVYRYQVIDRTYRFIADGVNERLRRITEEQKSGILKWIQQLLPPSLEDTLRDVQKVIQSGTEDVMPPLGQTTTTKTTTTTIKKPVKK